MHNNHFVYLNGSEILVEIFRGHTTEGKPIIDCTHRGLISVMDGLGNEVFSQGMSETMVHMRSCAKPLQVLPLLELGYFSEKTSSLTLADLALMMSSHAGESMHTKRVAKLLTTMGLDHLALRCGVHPPQDEETRRELIRTQTKPNALHNNCSGKHVAMLMACLKQNFDPTCYEDVDHPLQQWIRSLLVNLGDLTPNEIAFGIDGCSLPSWAIPLKKTALIYARLSLWQHDLPDHRPSWLKDAFATIWRAATHHAEFIAGTNRLDTMLIKAACGNIVSKTGADGIQALAIAPSKKYPTGLGIAIKISDGDARQNIRPLVIKYLLSQLDLWPHDDKLEQFLPSFKNYRGLKTGGALIQVKKIV